MRFNRAVIVANGDCLAATAEADLALTIDAALAHDRFLINQFWAVASFELMSMSLYFEELDYRPTPIGALSLRRRRELSLGVDVFEIKLGDEYLMSSLFTASEIALARRGLAELSAANMDVVVGGLGLGYTARAVLEHKAVKSLVIVEALDAVIDWHEKGVFPCRHGKAGLYSLRSPSHR
jgi:hypothetical protein